MSEQKKIYQKKSSSMFLYALTKLGANVLTSIALIALALGFLSIRKELSWTLNQVHRRARVHNDCVKSIIGEVMKASYAVMYCNGSNK